MAVDFNLPTVDTTYTAFPTQIIENIDAALQQLSVGSPSNVPTNAIKWDSSANRWKKFNGSAYVDLTGTYDLNAQVSVNQLNLGDDEAVRLGDSNDFQLFHRASDSLSIISESGGGYLSLQSNGSRIEMYDSANNRNMAEFNTGGACTFKHGATTRIATSNSGATITGDLTTTGQANIGTNVSLDGSSAGGNSRQIDIGAGRTADGSSLIDLIGDSTYTTYGARFIRVGGANANTFIQHRGTGALSLDAVDAGDVQLSTSNSSRLRILSNGDVGIGLTNPSHKLHIYSGSANALAVQSTVSGANILIVSDDTETKFQSVDGHLFIEADTQNNVAGSEIKFVVDGAIKFTIGTDGIMSPVGVGTVGFKVPDNSPVSNATSTHGAFIAGNNSDLMIFHDGSNSIINDNGTGELLLQRAGSTKFALSSIGATLTGNLTMSAELNLLGGSDAARFIDSQVGDGNALHFRRITGGDAGHENMAKFHGGGSCELYFDNVNKMETRSEGLSVHGQVFVANGAEGSPSYTFKNSTDTGFYRHAVNQIGVTIAGTKTFRFTDGQFGPLINDAIDLGKAGFRFDDVFATNGTINTSDQNLKNTIATSDLGLDFINKLNPVSYKFNGKTRTHYGLIAQEIEAVLGAISKPAKDFAGFCKDEVDEDGNSITPLYGLRYTEFISPIIKAIQELSAKVAALEAA